MKFILFKLVFTFSLVSFSSAQEKYFYDLRGYEDSTGTTQLFYRLKITSPNRGSSDILNYDFHVDSSSVLIPSYYYEWTIPGMYTYETIFKYKLLPNQKEKWLALRSREGSFFIQNEKRESLYFPFPIFIKKNDDYDFYAYFDDLTLDNKGDSLFVFFESTENVTIPISANPENWPLFSKHEAYEFGDPYHLMVDYFDSTGVNFHITGVHPNLEKTFYGLDNRNHLYKSTDYISDFQVVDSSALFLNNMAYDQDTSIIYALAVEGTGTDRMIKLARSMDSGDNETWSFIELNPEINRIRGFIADQQESGLLYITDSNSIYQSTNLRDSFEEVLFIEQDISGIYKKPNSPLIYVLTSQELFEYNLETEQLTFLLQVPVSNETTQSIPNSIALKQNYPNPFNPVTNIVFELSETAPTKLTIYDAIGREILLLVDEVRPAGNHTVQFNASNLSSGMYFYRLESGGEIQTKQLTLIK